MADTYTAFLNLTKPEVGASRDTWGDKWNTNATLIDNWIAAADPKIIDLDTNAARKNVATDQVFTAGVRSPAFYAQGANPGYTFNDRDDATKSWVLYGSGGIARLFRTGVGDVLTLSSAGTLTASAGATFGGTVGVTGQVAATQGFSSTVAGGLGRATIVPGTADYTGIMELYTPAAPNSDGRRAGYIGFAPKAGGAIPIVAETGFSWNFVGATNPKVSGNDIWHGGNFNPGNYVAKTGDAMTGNLQINKADPKFITDVPGVGGHALLSDGSNNWILQRQFGGAFTNLMYVNNAGRMWTAELGFINDRIEARGAAFADDRAQYRVAKTGDTMTGDLKITKGYPQLSLEYPGVFNWGIIAGNDGRLWLRNANSGTIYFQFSSDGSLYTSQIGDLNTRIETRAAAYANNMVSYTRLGSRGASALNGFGNAEPAPGNVLVGFSSDNNGKAYTMYSRPIQYVLGTGAVGNSGTI